RPERSLEDDSTLSPASRIVQAGRQLFFEKGFQNVSTDMLAKEAKVSKQSIYKYFGDMSAVLVAVTEAESENFFSPTPITIDSLETLEAELVRFGTALMQFLNREEIIRFVQLMYEQARANNDAASKFYDAAYGSSQTYLAELIEQGQTLGVVTQALTANELAMQLLGMWEFIPMVRVQMAKRTKPFSSPKAWAEKCVKTLLF
ncbi:MAG: TetR/AcrR family transcriptional regulator, partial [Cyanobacteria bacterium P01_F01_bin.42]